MVTAGAQYPTAIKSLWSGKCTVTVQQNHTNESTGRTVADRVDICTDEPCRISFQSVATTEGTDNAAKTIQNITLYIDPAITIPPGSRITVTQAGVTGTYEKSGVPAVYSHHQEIPLSLLEEWA
jgi:hypothetical protein